LYWGSNPNDPIADPNLLRDLGKLLTETQVELLGSGSTIRDMRKRRFHDFTVSSRGVLADVAAGGLKKDLTAGFLGNSIPTGAPANTDPLIKPSRDGVALTNTDWNVPDKLPSWGALRSYARLPLDYNISGSAPSISAIAPSDTSVGVGPVVLHHQMWVTATMETGNKINLLYFPAVVLWNPYDVTLKAQNYTGRFWFNPTNPQQPFRVYAEFATAANAAVKSWKWVESGIFSRYSGSQFGFGSKGIVIDCPDLPPGKAYVFSPSANQDYGAATGSAPLKLSQGWRTHFW
jgi:hypothetical protein